MKILDTLLVCNIFAKEAVLAEGVSPNQYCFSIEKQPETQLPETTSILLDVIHKELLNKG